MSLLKTTVSLTIATGEAVTFGNVAVSIPLNTQAQSNSNPLTSGTGAGQATHDQDVNIATSTGGVTLDLTAVPGVLDGRVRDWSNGGTGYIKCMVIENTDATNTITVSQPGSNGWTGLSGAATGLSVPIEPGGHQEFYSPAGRAVTSSNKDLTLTSNAGTPNAKITIIGIAA
jgi:hypothetical protein